MTQQLLGVQGIVRVFQVPVALDAPASSAELERLCRRGHARMIVETHNRVTDIGLNTLTGLLAGGFGTPLIGANAYNETTIHDGGVNPLTGAYVASMRITAHPFGALTPPANADNALQGTVILQRAMTGVPPLIATYPATGQVKWQILIGNPDYNGTTFTEEGLFSADNQLVARTTFQALKTSAYGLQFEHLVALTRI